MKITKFTHSCILVEMLDRTALFDPGTMSRELLDSHEFQFLDDILITHSHPDHMDIEFIKKLVDKFPEVRVTAPADALNDLRDAGINQATDTLPEGVKSFDAPHEDVEPMFPTPQQHGYHYLDKFTTPGDSHTFNETCAVLALPVTAPWGSNVKAVNLAIELKPQYVIPIHDWHWREEARQQQYDAMDEIFAQNNIKFIKTEDGTPFNLEV